MSKRANAMYRYKQAETDDEFEQIFRLNYEVFVDELGQHPPRADARLVDKFHAKNRYAIALEGDHVVGMIAFHAEPPFSVAEKLADPGVLTALGSIAEIRLLAIAREHRSRRVLRGLFLAVYHQSLEYDAIVISGRVEEEKMYTALGFRALGPAVESGASRFIPMAVRVRELFARASKWQGPRDAVNRHA